MNFSKKDYEQSSQLHQTLICFDKEIRLMITISGTKEEIETFAEGIIKANEKGGKCFLSFKERECSIDDFRPCEL